MAAELLPTCKCCGRKFTPDARNRDRQQICGHPDCRRMASRAKKRRYYQNRKKNDPDFLEAERERCRNAMRVFRGKSGQQQRTEPPLRWAHELFVGLVSQLGGTSDPAEVAAIMNAYAARGRRLAVAAPVRGSPD